MCGIFKLRSEKTYNLKQSSQFFTPTVNSWYHGTESVSFLGPKNWDLVTKRIEKYKQSSSI